MSSCRSATPYSPSAGRFCRRGRRLLDGRPHESPNLDRVVELEFDPRRGRREPGYVLPRNIECPAVKIHGDPRAKRAGTGCKVVSAFERRIGQRQKRLTLADPAKRVEIHRPCYAGQKCRNMPRQFLRELPQVNRSTPRRRQEGTGWARWRLEAPKLECGFGDELPVHRYAPT